MLLFTSKLALGRAGFACFVFSISVFPEVKKKYIVLIAKVKVVTLPQSGVDVASSCVQNWNWCQ